MKRMAMSRLLLVLFLFALLCPAASGVKTASSMPTLFRNDEAWYRDAVEPLIRRGGELYIPADFFGMFNGISVTTPTDDNLLAQNTVTGEYVSLLLSDGSSVVNGEIGRTVGSFRDGTAWYLEANPVCGALGLKIEVLFSEGGGVTLRITDGTERLSAQQLSASYAERSEGEETNAPSEEDSSKLLYIFVTSPGDDKTYSAEARLEKLGVQCTVFLWDDAESPAVLAGHAHGDYGIVTKDEQNTIASLIKANDRMHTLTRRLTRWTLAAGDESGDRILRLAGFCPVTPDFTVDSETDLDELSAGIISRFWDSDRVAVFLTDCWNGTEAAELLSKMLNAHPGWKACNLGGS